MDVTTNLEPAAAPDAPSADHAVADTTVSPASGNGTALAALLCSVVALILAGPIAVVAWPFMIAAIVLVVLARRRGATRTWMTVLAIVLVVFAVLVSLVMPTIILVVGFLMFGAVDPGDAIGSYWHFWSGAYLFEGEIS